MKRILAITLAFAVILVCFAACKKDGVIEGGVVITGRGEPIAVVTAEGGKLFRDEAGNMIVLVTDENGNNVLDENGDPVTQKHAVEHGMIVGNRVEMPEYGMEIPDGWTLTGNTWANLVITNDKNTQIKLFCATDTTLASQRAAYQTIIEEAKKIRTGGVITTKEVTVKGESAQLISIWDASAPLYYGYITFSHNGVVYCCELQGTTDLNIELETIVNIVNTIEYSR